MSFYHINPAGRGERLARRLAQYDDYRVLRRLPRPNEIWCRSMPVPDTVVRLAIVDCETTGLDPDRHRMIEFSVGMLLIDPAHGDVVGVRAPRSWLEDPAEDLPVEIERLTRITADMLIGHAFREDEITSALAGADVIVAHHAEFDKNFAIRRFPRLAALPWACSMSEIDWPALGWSGGRGIEALLTAAGFFLPGAHRAAEDVWATTCLLASTAPDGRAIAAHLYAAARRQSSRLYAASAPFEIKNALKAAGYRWSPDRRAWWIEGDAERIANEAAWVKTLSSRVRPIIVSIDWMNRHNA